MLTVSSVSSTTWRDQDLIKGLRNASVTGNKLSFNKYGQVMATVLMLVSSLEEHQGKERAFKAAACLFRVKNRR